MYKKRPRWDTPELAEKKKNGTPCETCMPELRAENVLAVQLYEVCADQLIVAGMGQAVGVWMPSIFEAVKHHPRASGLSMQERWDLATDVQLMGRTIIALQNKDTGKKDGMRGNGKGNS